MMEINGRRFVCDECPISWGLERQIELSEKYGVEPQFEYCGCDKTGEGKFYVCGFCDDAFITYPEEKKSGRRKTGRAYRRRKAKQKDDRLRSIIASGGYKPMIGFIDYGLVDGVWQEVGNHIKYPRNSNYQRYLKQQSNKRVRRYKAEIPKGNSYRKLFEYWWELY